MSFVEGRSDWHPATVPVIINVLSYNIGPLYNVTRLYYVILWISYVMSSFGPRLPHLNYIISPKALWNMQCIYICMKIAVNKLFMGFISDWACFNYQSIFEACPHSNVTCHPFYLWPFHLNIWHKYYIIYSCHVVPITIDRQLNYITKFGFSTYQHK